MSRLMVTLRTDELDALWKLSECELRDPRAQAALIIRDELTRRGLLATEPPAPAQAQPEPEGVQRVAR